MMSAAPVGPQVSLSSGLKEIYSHMPSERRRQFFNVLLLMLAGAAAELATIGAVIPLLTLLAGGSGGLNPSLKVIFGSRGDSSVLFAAGAFMLLAVAAALVRLQFAKSSRNFIYGIGHELTVEIQRRVLLQPFSFHIHRNTSTLLTALNKAESLVGDLLLPLMLAVTGTVIAFCVVGLLVLVAPVTTVFVAVSLTIAYALIFLLTRNRLTILSAIAKAAYDERMQVVQESLDGIRDVIIDRSQSMYLRQFAEIDLTLAEARAQSQLIYLGPRYVVEMFGMIAIAAIAVVIGGRNGGLAAALPVLGALALGAQRLLPLVQDIYRGWSAVHGERSVFVEIVEFLSLPVEQPVRSSHRPFRISREIRIEDVTFAYPTRTDAALKDVTLTVPCGSMLALVGPTGSGKSTLADVMMGLLRPKSGRILIDDLQITDETKERWHRSIAHVPQSIFLADASISSNIALSLPDREPDQNRIVAAAKHAQLHDFIVSLPTGYETLVGERGIRLSGGQRQRLGIARAIYKKTPVLVLDEATNALDDVTERAIIAALETLKHEGSTVIIVAHRLSTISQCDLIARLEHGRLVEFGPTIQFIGRKDRPF